MLEFKTMRFKNFLSYGNTWSVIDFSQLPTQSVMIAESGSGKSTILDVLVYGLFGKPFRKIKKDEIVNYINKKDCLVEIEFTTHGKSYLVRRGLKPQIFDIEEDGMPLKENSKIRDFQKILENQILKINYKSFTQIILLGSTNFKQFMDLSPGHRREIVEDLLDISIFSTMLELMKPKAVSTAADITSIEGAIKTDRKLLKENENFLVQLENIHKDTLNKHDNEIEEVQSKIESLLKLQKQSKTDCEEYYPAVDRHDKLLVAWNALTYDAKSLVSEIKRRDNEFDKISKLDFCKICKQDISKEHVDHMQQTHDQQIENIKLEQDKYVILIEDNVNERDKLTTTMGKYHTALRESKSHAADLTLENRTLNKLQHKESVDTTEIDKIEARILSIENDLKDRVVTLQKRKLKAKYLAAGIELLQDDGIKKQIVLKYLPKINLLINEYLRKLNIYFHVVLNELFEETIMDRHGAGLSYNGLSDGEKLRFDLALTFAWRDIAKMKSAAVNCDLLVLDEITSNLDRNNLYDFLNVLADFKDQKTMIISHNADIQEAVSYQIKIEKVGNFSRIMEK